MGPQMLLRPGPLLRCACRCLSSSVVHTPTDGGGTLTIGRALLTYRSSVHATSVPPVLDLTHTRVPSDMRGQRVAARLCDAAFDLARTRQARVLPTCSYIRDRYVPNRIKDAESDVGDIALRELDSSTPGLQIELDWHGVATLRLTEARRRNPLTRPLLGRMRDWLRRQADARPAPDAGEACNAADGVRAIVIESSGPVWSSGHDFNDFAGQPAETAREVLDLCAEVNTLLSLVPQASTTPSPSP